MICPLSSSFLEKQESWKQRMKLSNSSRDLCKRIKNAAALVRCVRWRGQGIFQEMGLNSAGLFKCLQPECPTKY